MTTRHPSLAQTLAFATMSNRLSRAKLYFALSRSATILYANAHPLALPCTRSPRGSGLWRQFAGSVAIWCRPRQHCAPTPVPAERRRLIMRTIMNKILLVGGLFAAVPATAQTYDPRYPVCIEVYTIDGSTIDCSFKSIAQCAATASGQAAQCYANPYVVQSRQPGLGPSPPRRNR